MRVLAFITDGVHRSAGVRERRSRLLLALERGSVQHAVRGLAPLFGEIHAPYTHVADDGRLDRVRR